MSTSPLRSAMVPITRQMRVYFAPVNRIDRDTDNFRSSASGAFRAGFPAGPVGGFGLD